MAIVDKSGSHWEKEANAIQYIKLNIYCLSLATVKRSEEEEGGGGTPRRRNDVDAAEAASDDDDDKQLCHTRKHGLNISTNSLCTDNTKEIQ